MDRRIAKTVDPDGAGAETEVSTNFVYDGDNVFLEFEDSSGSPTLSNRYLHELRTDRVLAQEDSNGRVLWLLGDHLGTIRDLVDANGATVNRFTYDSFGNAISQTNPAESTRYQFTGREFDGETGLYYYRARYYDGKIGRFLSEDPIGFEGGDSNLYAYVKNSPIQVTDPSGKDPYYGQVIAGTEYTRKIVYQTQMGQKRTVWNTQELINAGFFAPASILQDDFAAVFRHEQGTAPVKYPNPNRILGNRTGNNPGDDRGHILPFLLGGVMDPDLANLLTLITSFGRTKRLTGRIIMTSGSS